MGFFSSMGSSINYGAVGAALYEGLGSNKLHKKIIDERDVTYIYAANLPYPKSINDLSILLYHSWIPMALTDSQKEIFRKLQVLYDNGFINIKNNQVELKSNIKEKLLKGEIDTFLGVSFKESDILQKQESRNFIKNTAIQNLLESDTHRIQLAPYHRKCLEDPNMGHWELWDYKPTSNADTLIATMPEGLIARNPIIDIHKDGIVGIDFGTKSTIVVYQDGNDQTRPMRIGSGNFNKKVRSSDYENPTVMEFINLSHFLEKYHEKAGRPETLWEDVTISHTAMNSLFSSNIKSNEYYAFFNDLKQWAGDKNRATRIRDKKGFESILPSFLELTEDDLNPIELYAYYLGLFINNMYNGIYLNYMLSFPVTYEKAVREKIIDSFERGLKKSLPEAVLNDAESMKKFRVLQGASEPAAYAICALQEYGFEPEENEEVFYGIFDFGGGTTDFDFGIWKCADETERRYDYVIKHFGAGGDQYLGGENLLELLAYEVFKANQEVLIAEGITFYKPTECQPFAGSEVLISNAQEARLNTKQLMEKLRPLWEQHDGYEREFDKGSVKVMLFNRDGQPKPNFELVVELESLQKVLTDRIEKGVKNFFEALKLTFMSQEVQHMKEVAIFLAGNSSKSPIVKALFDKYIAELTQEIRNQFDASDMETYFTVYPPLGSEEAKSIQKERGIVYGEREALLCPTGKTGVAYGLLEGRPGSRIKVISEIKATDEVKFKYYLGYVSRKKFKVVVNRTDAYHTWIPFIDASEADFELYYTNLPEATTNQLASHQVSKKICRIHDTYDDANVYLRIVEPTKVEYIVMGQDGNALSEVQKIELA